MSKQIGPLNVFAIDFLKNGYWRREPEASTKGLVKIPELERIRPSRQLPNSLVREVIYVNQLSDKAILDPFPRKSQ